MEIDATHLENLAQRQMFDDPPCGIFNKRIIFPFFMMAQNSNMSEKERGDVFDLLHVIALKFVSVWRHDQRFEKRQNEMLAASEAEPVDRRINKPCASHPLRTCLTTRDAHYVERLLLADAILHQFPKRRRLLPTRCGKDAAFAVADKLAA